ncbi:MAG: hypothetical protein AAGK78_06460 [Planctomycetota bacterium]
MPNSPGDFMLLYDPSATADAKADRPANPTSIRPATEAASEAGDVPDLDRQAALILSAMDAAAMGAVASGHVTQNRRDRNSRVSWHVRGELRLFADPDHAEPWPIFTRDLEPRAHGFVAPDRMPLGYGGFLAQPSYSVMSMCAPAVGLPCPGQSLSPLKLEVTLTRCRSCPGGWYEGALYFHVSQPELVDAVRRL